MHRAFLVTVAAVYTVLCFNPNSALGGGKQWAILVGVDQYAKIGNLDFAGNDQRAFADELVRLGFPKDQVTLLHDVSKEKRFLPFRENVERELDLLTSIVSPDDTVVFAFSGHGVHIDGKSYLCPTEADFENAERTLIPLESIFERLRKCNATLKVMFIDACRNDPRPKGSRGPADPFVTASFAESLERPPQGLLLLTSCSPGQISKEDEKLQHGVFMYHILDGLRGKAANRDGLITLSSLYDYSSLATKKYVAQRWGDYQSPAMKGELSGSFELARIDISKIPVAPEKKLEKKVQAGTLTGWWSGSYSYPAQSQKQTVGFSFLVIQDGSSISGFIKERNTFGENDDPFLHASFRGSYDEGTLKFSFRKTYDGTSNIDHDVLYWGSMSSDESSVIDGQWQIRADWADSFKLTKDKDSHAGKYSGTWTGTMYFPESTGREPSKFSMIVAHKGKDLIGLIKERRVYGSGDDPWLHATAYATVDEQNGRMKITKTYDGTAGVTGTEVYEGKLTGEDELILTGTRTANAREIGTFTLMLSDGSK
jgi:hypothetical protein